MSLPDRTCTLDLCLTILTTKPLISKNKYQKNVSFILMSATTNG